jgi:hypothetical protein
MSNLVRERERERERERGLLKLGLVNAKNLFDLLY